MGRSATIWSTCSYTPLPPACWRCSCVVFGRHPFAKIFPRLVQCRRALSGWPHWCSRCIPSVSNQWRGLPSRRIRCRWFSICSPDWSTSILQNPVDRGQTVPLSQRQDFQFAQIQRFGLHVSNGFSIEDAGEIHLPGSTGPTISQNSVRSQEYGQDAIDATVTEQVQFPNAIGLHIQCVHDLDDRRGCRLLVACHRSGSKCSGDSTRIHGTRSDKFRSGRTAPGIAATERDFGTSDTSCPGGSTAAHSPRKGVCADFAGRIAIPRSSVRRHAFDDCPSVRNDCERHRTGQWLGNQRATGSGAATVHSEIPITDPGLSPSLQKQPGSVLALWPCSSVEVWCVAPDCPAG